MAVGFFLSSVTENQVIAAVLSFAILFLSYVSEGIAGLFPQTEKASLAAFILLIFLVCLWIGSMIKNVIITGTITLLAEVTLIISYIVKPSLLEGLILIQKFFGIFNFTSHFDNFINGVLDINGVVYFLSVVIICLFLANQTMQKRRWS